MTRTDCEFELLLWSQGLADGIRLFRDATERLCFDVYSADDKPTGKLVTYLNAERNGRHWSYGFEVGDKPSRDADKALDEFKRYLDIPKEKIV